MHAVKMKERIDYHTDKVRNPRWFIDTNYVPSLNIACADFIDDRYDNIKQATQAYAFETAQKLKDELYTIVKTVPILPVNGIITLPVDYMHDVGLMITIDGKKTPSIPITHNELIVINENSFSRPDVQYPVHYQDERGINILYGGYGTITTAFLSYVREMKDIVMYADPLNRTQFLALTNVNPLIIGYTYYVLGNVPANHNGVLYQPGTTFVAVNTVLIAGTVTNIVNCELPVSTHEEICKMASASLTGRALGLLKNKLLNDDIKSN